MEQSELICFYDPHNKHKCSVTALWDCESQLWSNNRIFQYKSDILRSIFPWYFTSLKMVT